MTIDTPYTIPLAIIPHIVGLQGATYTENEKTLQIKTDDAIITITKTSGTMKQNFIDDLIYKISKYTSQGEIHIPSLDDAVLKEKTIGEKQYITIGEKQYYIPKTYKLIQNEKRKAY